MHKNTHGKQLQECTVLPKRQVYTQKCASQLNTGPGTGACMATVHLLGRNGTSNNRDSDNLDCRVFALST